MLPAKKRRLDQPSAPLRAMRPAAASALHCELLRFAEEATPMQVRFVTACRRLQGAQGGELADHCQFRRMP